MQIVRWCRLHWFSLGVLLIFLLPWLAFGRSLTQDFAAIDDSYLIVNNPIVHGVDFSHIKLAFTTFDPELYIPLTLTSFQFDWLFGGGSPLPFHVTNILLQSLNAILVAFLFVHWTKNRALSVIAALIFAVHPLHTEAVVWAAGRKDLLCTFFFLSSYVSFVRFRSSRRAEWLVASLVLFLCALLSKALAATLPAVLVLEYFLMEGTWKALSAEQPQAGMHSMGSAQVPARRERALFVLTLVPYAILAAIFLCIATFGKEQILASSTLWQTLVMAQKSAAFYLGKILLPVGLTVIYPFQGTISLASAEFLLPMILNLGLIILAIIMRKRWALITFGILFYFITLSPTFFNFHKGNMLFFAVDRYAYIPSIGILLALLTLAAAFVRFLDLRKDVVVPVSAVLIGVLIAGSIAQSTVWDSPDALFGRTLQLYPQSVSARTALVSVLRQRNQLQEAFALLKEGLKYGSSVNLSMEAGLIYMASGQLEDAREQFQTILAKDPTLSPAMYSLGYLDEHDGQLEGAMRWYRRAIAQDASYVAARVRLAHLLLQGKASSMSIAEAATQLSLAYRWNKTSPEVIAGLISLERMRGNRDALDHWMGWAREFGLLGADGNVVIVGEQ